MSNEKYKDIIEKIESMSVLDVSELVKALEEKFGVSASAPAFAGQMGGAQAAQDAGEAAPEKTSYDVELTSAGDQKIAMIKVVKEALGLGLKEAKDMVDKAPLKLKEGMKKEEAEALKKSIEGAGGKAEIK